jgi:hypothetical protein
MGMGVGPLLAPRGPPAILLALIVSVVLATPYVAWSRHHAATRMVLT